jgi:hypothetical protein
MCCRLPIFAIILVVTNLVHEVRAFPKWHYIVVSNDASQGFEFLAVRQAERRERDRSSHRRYNYREALQQDLRRRASAKTQEHTGDVPSPFNPSAQFRRRHPAGEDHRSEA